MAESSKVKHYAAGLLVQRGKILLLQHDPGHCRGCWSLPGGPVRENETPEQALADRLQEQLKVRIAVAERLVETECGDGGMAARVTCCFCTMQPEAAEPSSDRPARWVSLLDFMRIPSGHPVEGISGLCPLETAVVSALNSDEFQWRTAKKSKHWGHGKKLFAYAESAACGCIGQEGGASLTVFENGDMVLNRFLFFFEKYPYFQRCIHADKAMTAEIRQAIAARKRDLQQMPESLSFGTDGICYAFCFQEKTVTALNIGRYDPDTAKPEARTAARILSPGGFKWVDQREQIQGDAGHAEKLRALFGEIAAIISRHRAGISYSYEKGFCFDDGNGGFEAFPPSWPRLTPGL